MSSENNPGGGRDDVAGVIAPPPVIFAVPLLVSLAVNRRLKLRLMPERFRGLRRLAGLALVVCALGIFLGAGAAMRRKETSINPYRPSAKIVDDGPFAHTRNPIYVAMTLLYTGVTLLGDSLVSALLLPVILRVVTKGVIEREEAYLKRRFGLEYERYMERVGRWF